MLLAVLSTTFIRQKKGVNLQLGSGLACWLDWVSVQGCGLARIPKKYIL